MAHKVSCPFCHGTLYETVPLDSQGTPAMKHGSGPHLDNDDRGYFMSCQHCGKRVGMAQTIGPTGLAGFKVADQQ